MLSILAVGGNLEKTQKMDKKETARLNNCFWKTWSSLFPNTSIKYFMKQVSDNKQNKQTKSTKINSKNKITNQNKTTQKLTK